MPETRKVSLRFRVPCVGTTGKSITHRCLPPQIQTGAHNANGTMRK